MWGVGSQKRNSRTDQLLNLFRARRGQDVPAYEVARIAGLQYGRAVHTLRKRGHVIFNREEWHDGVRITWFRLEEPTPVPTLTRVPGPTSASSDSLFGDISPERSYLE